MFSKIIKRVLASVATLFAIITVSFFMMKFAPGGPFDQEKSPPENIRKAIMAKYHLDKPLYKQYFIYLGGLAQLDLGPSFKVAHLTVNEVISEGIGPTLKLGALAMFIAVSFGLIIGLIAALNHNSWMDHFVMSTAMLGISIPNMVLAPILLLFLGIKMRLLPVSGLETASSYILPAFCLSLFFIANIARLTRGSMLEVLSSNYIRTARSKGLPTWRIVTFHCLKPTLIPVVSYLGPATAGMLAGSLVIEKIFVIPGIGRQFVDSAFARDYTMALGMILFYCTLVVFFNALVDISYMFLDPKIRK
ncbi:MAG: oligopeptide transporter permease [Halobacteriovoraceae bacterium]|nr:oligopeptide transporter permease [Halobacteriovoraceae bacterium]